MHSKKDLAQNEQGPEHTDYEAPRIESVMTPEALEREVQYAGTTDGASQAPPR